MVQDTGDHHFVTTDLDDKPTLQSTRKQYNLTNHLFFVHGRDLSDGNF